MRITDILERPQSRELLADWYASALKDQATSGLSVAEYADEIGVSSATLYQWRRRLADDDERIVVDSPSEPELIEVVLAAHRSSEAASVRSASLTVQLGASRAIEVSSEFDTEALQRLVRALEAC